MNILIVDDESLAREELEFLVKDNPKVSAVYEADTIDAAFRVISEFKIDLLFLDIQLGEENGFDLADDLKTKKNALKSCLLLPMINMRLMHLTQVRLIIY